MTRMDSLTTVLILFSLPTFGASQNITCQSLGASVLVEFKCLQIFNDTMSWKLAQAYCAKHVYNGILAEPLTVGERDAVKNITISTKEGAWLGGSDIQMNKSLTWNKSQQLVISSFDNTSWNAGEPNNEDYLNCVKVEADGLLTDVSCTLNNIRPLCQTDIKNQCEGVFPGSLFATGYCFKYYDNVKTWQDAKSSCLLNNSHLAEPTSPDMHRTLTIYLRKIPYAWIGASKINKTNSFYWETSGKQVNSEYMNLTDGLGEDRHLLWYNAEPYKVNWTDRPGNDEYGFVCQTAYLKRNASQYLAIVPKKLVSSETKMYINVSTANEFVVYVTFQLLDGWSNLALDERTLALSNETAVCYELNFTISQSDAPPYFVKMKSTEPLVIGCYVEGQAQRLSCSTTHLSSQLFNATIDILLISAVPEPPDYVNTTTEFTTASSTEGLDETTVQLLNTTPSKTTENISKAEMDSMIHEFQDQIKKELLVQYRNVSQFRRTKTTAEDKRRSSEVIGSVIGIGTMVFVFSLICIGDVVACGYFFFHFLKSKFFPFKEEQP